jgi:hypothetical protein
MEFTVEIKATWKHIITCCILQTPPLTPWTLFRICIFWPSIWHSIFG